MMPSPPKNSSPKTSPRGNNHPQQTTLPPIAPTRILPAKKVPPAMRAATVSNSSVSGSNTNSPSNDQAGNHNNNNNNPVTTNTTSSSSSSSAGTSATTSALQANMTVTASNGGGGGSSTSFNVTPASSNPPSPAAPIAGKKPQFKMSLPPRQLENLHAVSLTPVATPVPQFGVNNNGGAATTGNLLSQFGSGVFTFGNNTNSQGVAFGATASPGGAMNYDNNNNNPFSVAGVVNVKNNNMNGGGFNKTESPGGGFSSSGTKTTSSMLMGGGLQLTTSSSNSYSINNTSVSSPNHSTLFSGVNGNDNNSNNNNNNNNHGNPYTYVNVSSSASPSAATATISLAGFHANEVYPNIYLGAVVDAQNATLLRSLGIVRILNVAAECDFSPSVVACKEITTKKIPLKDSADENISRVFADTFEFIDEGINRQKGKVLVHCFVGSSRSPTVVIAYIMKKMWQHEHHQSAHLGSGSDLSATYSNTNIHHQNASSLLVSTSSAGTATYCGGDWKESDRTRSFVQAFNQQHTLFMPTATTQNMMTNADTVKFEETSGTNRKNSNSHETDDNKHKAKNNSDENDNDVSHSLLESTATGKNDLAASLSGSLSETAVKALTAKNIDGSNQNNTASSNLGFAGLGINSLGFGVNNNNSNQNGSSSLNFNNNNNSSNNSYYHTALALVQAKRECYPNIGFVQALLEYEKALRSIAPDAVTPRTMSPQRTVSPQKAGSNNQKTNSNDSSSSSNKHHFSSTATGIFPSSESTAPFHHNNEMHVQNSSALIHLQNNNNNHNNGTATSGSHSSPALFGSVRHQGSGLGSVFGANLSTSSTSTSMAPSKSNMTQVPSSGGMLTRQGTVMGASDDGGSK